MKTPHIRFAIALLLLTLALAKPTFAVTFSIEKTSAGGAVVKLDGEFLTELIVDQANKIYLWPVIGTSGVTMTRAINASGCGRAARPPAPPWYLLRP